MLYVRTVQLYIYIQRSELVVVGVRSGGGLSRGRPAPLFLSISSAATFVIFCLTLLLLDDGEESTVFRFEKDKPVRV